MTDYLTVVEVLAIHDDQIDHYCGSAGMRDRGSLEAALYRRQTGYYADLFEEAATLWESLAQNRAFIDGNKRTTFAVTYTFLAVNGARITAKADATYAFIIGLHEADTFEFGQLADWLRADVTPAPPGLRVEPRSRVQAAERFILPNSNLFCLPYAAHLDFDPAIGLEACDQRRGSLVALTRVAGYWIGFAPAFSPDFF
jgi:death-on-curing protein